MANLGVGAEANAHFKQWEDLANRGPICTTDSCTRGTHEPTGLPESLCGKNSSKPFDDPATRGKLQELEKKIKKPMKNNKIKQGEWDTASAELESTSQDTASTELESQKHNKGRRIQQDSNLSLAHKIWYRPKAEEKLAACESFLSLIQHQFGGQVLARAADEVLSVLKNEMVENPDNKTEIEKPVNPSTNQFDQIDSTGRMITDFQGGGGAGGSTVTVNVDDEALDTTGVSVEFNMDEVEEEHDFQQILEEPDQDDMKEAKYAVGKQTSGIDAAEIEEAKESFTVNVQDIEACIIDGEIGNRRVVISRDSRSNGWAKGQRQLLDLESIAFQEGGFLMGKKKCVLPFGSCMRLYMSYNEVHVPTFERKPVAQGRELVKITQLPEWARPAFAGMNQLNQVQSRVYKTAFLTHENVLLCAPTGVGKLNVVMLSILREIGLHRNEAGEVDSSKYRIVYVAPMEALVAQIVGILSRRLRYLNINVKGLIGDQRLTRHEIDETHIIVTTLEKWDAVTRKPGDRRYTQMVKLLIIDEIHLLHGNRGPVLESIVARRAQQIEMTKEQIRVVGLSANLPNYEDVALFLQVHPTKGLFHFDDSFRHCPLAQQHIEMIEEEPLERNKLMNGICYEKVLAGAGKHQTLVFVHSDGETSKTARSIRDTALANDTLRQFLKDDSASNEFLRSQAELVESNDLKELLPCGLAIHHAGMDSADRYLVEGLFADGHIQVLVSTASLAWEVHLPAHTVIIKGTQTYNPERGSYTELSHLDVLQMMGRAGRPHYDSYGEGIIISEHGDLEYYLSVVNRQLPIESQFISKLADQLNAEIASGAIQNAQEACTWIGYTYLYTRMIRNPTLYGIPADVVDKDRTLEERRADLIHSAASILDKNNLIKYDRKSGYFQITDLGRIASNYNITHGTIGRYNEYLKPTTDDIELLRIVSLSEEFKHVCVRKDEKMELAKLIDTMPIPVKESLEEASAKVNLLLQAYMSQLKLEGHSLASDVVYIGQSARRLLPALYEIVRKKGWTHLAEKALNLCMMVDKQQHISNERECNII